MKRILTIFMICFTAFALRGEPPQSSSKIAGRIQIHGSRYFTDDAIRDYMIFHPGKTLPEPWPSESLRNLAEKYHEEGYYAFQIDSLLWRTDQAGKLIHADLWMTEGEPFRVGQIEIISRPDLIQKDILRKMESRSGSVFRESILEEDIRKILMNYANQGYPLNQVEILSLRPVYEDSLHPRIDIHLKIEKGVSVQLSSIHITGNQQTSEKVILRESRLKTGYPYQQQKIEMAQKYLQRLEYFEKVDDPEQRFQGSKASVTLRVKEGRTNTIDGVVGFSPPKNENEKGYITGRLEFLFRNLLGTGRFLEAFWEKKDAFSQAMRFGYEEPWLFGWPVYLGGQFNQIIRDSTYIERAWKVSLRYQPSPLLTLKLQGGQTEILPDSIGSALYNLSQTESWLLSLGFDYNTFDNMFNPAKGIRYNTILTLGRKKNLGPDNVIQDEDFDKIRNTRFLQIDAEAVLPTFRHQLLYCGLHGTEVKTGETFIPLSDLVRFGGARTLRGYHEDSFYGSLVVWFNLEYRYLLARQSRVFVFIDGGMYQRRDRNEGFVKGTKMGYGIGIRMETRLGLIGIDYGIGEGDGLLKGKVHVGLINRF